MIKWKKYRLGDVVTSNLKNMEKDYPYKIIRYLDTGSIKCGKVETYQEFNLEDAPSRAKRLVKEHDIIYSNVRPIQRHYGYIKKPPENLVVSTGFSVISTNVKLADSLYIYYLLSTKEIVELLDSIAEGSTSAYPSLKPSDIENLEIILPPLSEQKEIAGILSSLDDKIDLLHRQNKTLEAIMYSAYKNSIRNNSSLIKLSELVNIYDKNRIPLSSIQRNKMKSGILFPYYGATSILDYVNNFIFDGEYILFAEDGTVESNDGKPILQLVATKFWVNNHTHVLQSKSSISNYLLYTILKNINISHIITGAVQPKISQSNLKMIEIEIPNGSSFEELSNISMNLWLKAKQNSSKVSYINKLIKLLMRKIISTDKE